MTQDKEEKSYKRGDGKSTEEKKKDHPPTKVINLNLSLVNSFTNL
jgi:hypothetical protein